MRGTKRTNWVMFVETARWVSQNFDSASAGVVQEMLVLQCDTAHEVSSSLSFSLSLSLCLFTLHRTIDGLSIKSLLGDVQLVQSINERCVALPITCHTPHTHTHTQARAHTRSSVKKARQDLKKKERPNVGRRR